MPSRGSYRVASLEEGKRLERDHSFRSCMLTLLIFFFLCLTLLLASLPWKGQYSPKNSPEEYEYQDKHDKSAQNSGERNRGIITSTENVEIITEKQKEEKRTPILFERYSNNVTSTPEPDDIKTESNTILELESATETSVSYADRIISDSTPTSEQDISSTIPAVTSLSVSLDSELTSSSSEVSTERFTELYKDQSLRTTDNYDNETATRETQSIFTSTASSAEEDATDTTVSSTLQIEEIRTSVSSVADAILTNEATEFLADETRANTESVNIITESYNQSDSVWTTGMTEIIRGAETETSVITNRLVITTMHPPINNTTNEEICVSNECKQIASKMLFYMNHSSDPCEDFYEYACGTFETDPQTIDRDLENIAYQRIAREMRKNNRKRIMSPFSKYYNSCLDYETKSLTDRITLVKEELNKIGKFYTTDNWHENQDSITDLLAKLLLHHSPLLFDIAPDLNERVPEQYTLKIGPTIFKDPFESGTVDDACFSDEIDRDVESVDLRELYKEYRMCKKDTKKYISSIGEALTQLGVFDELKNEYNISQYIQTTVINIDLEIIQKYYAAFPGSSEIREAYLMKNYTYVRVKNLSGDTQLVNWTQLITTLTDKYVLPEAQLQVYFHDKLIQGLKSLEDFGRRNAMQLHNALLGLYARNLYQVLVIERHQKPKEHCLRVATNLMIPEASSLYISSYSEDELSRMKRTIHRVFESLKETLKIKIGEVTWTTDEGRYWLEKKVDALKLAVPDISYFIDESSTFKNSTTDKFYLSSNYVENSMILMRRYRTLIYAELFTNPRDLEQIWTHYATPFQSKGLAIYGLNLVVIPFGVVDWSTVVYDNSLQYLNLATLGTVIAQEIAHHFDANGIYYWNETRRSNSFLSENELPNSNFEEYINCQKNVHFQSSMKLTLPSTGQTVHYPIPQLTLNERLSEANGLRLAYDTLDRLRSSEESGSLLPWLGSNRAAVGVDELFYLAYAQMHCTKVPLTSSYVSLFENEQLPSRIRILLSGSSNQHLGQTWSCPTGSGMVPSYTCNVFPYLQSTDFVSVYTE